MEIKDLSDGWIQTYTGLKINVFEPDESMICIEDIAHGLSNTCRWGGHCREFYSVAQHCVLTTSLCSKGDMLWALMHDAAEAYIGDIPTPIKKCFSGIDKIEEDLLAVIAHKFGLDGFAIPDSVKKADRTALGIEAYNLMDPEVVNGWYGENPMPDVKLAFWSPEKAKEIFLGCFEILSK